MAFPRVHTHISPAANIIGLHDVTETVGAGGRAHMHDGREMSVHVFLPGINVAGHPTRHEFTAVFSAEEVAAVRAHTPVRTDAFFRDPATGELSAFGQFTLSTEHSLSKAPSAHGVGADGRGLRLKLKAGHDPASPIAEALFEPTVGVERQELLIDVAGD